MKDAQRPDHVSLTTLVGRLREGRYVIPDSRSVDEVTRREGEAALIWFRQVLELPTGIVS
jgi:hypothetical protein